MFKSTLDAELQASSDTMALMFGIPNTDEEDSLVEAAAAMARNRYDNTPWGEDRVSDAAEAAVIAEWMYKPTKNDGGLYYKANYVIGMASGMMRASAHEDSAAQRFVQVFSDLIPDEIEDEEEYIGALLGTGAVFSPVDTQAAAYNDDWEFNPDAAVFYTKDGVVTLHEVAKRIAHTGMSEVVIAEMFTSGDFSPVNDLSDDVYERLVGWVAGSDSVTEFEEEVEPETCPLDWVTITDKNGVSTIELRRGMGCTTMTPNVDETYVAPFDYVTEEWTSATLEGWTTWRRELDHALADAEAGVEGADKRVATLKATVLPVRTNAMPELANGFSAEYADPEMVWNRAAGSRFIKSWNSKTGVHYEVLVDVSLIGMVVDAILELKLAIPKAQRKGITIEELVSDDELLCLVNPAMAYTLRTAANYNQMMGRFAHLVSSEVFVKGTLAAIRRVAGIEYDILGVVEDVDFSMEKLRTQIIEDVTSGKTFASRAVVVLAKLDGLHKNEARAIGNEVYERSCKLKNIFAQKRFSPMAEMLIAEHVYPISMNLPNNVVGLVGMVSKDYAQSVLANIGKDVVIVGTTKHNRELAAELGIRYIAIPRASMTLRAQRWAEGQVMASSTHVIAKLSESDKQATAARLDAAGIQYRFE